MAQSITPDVLRLAQAIEDALISPSESDVNDEPANVVDGLFAIARSLEKVAAALESVEGD